MKSDVVIAVKATKGLVLWSRRIVYQPMDNPFFDASCRRLSVVDSVTRNTKTQFRRKAFVKHCTK